MKTNPSKIQAVAEWPVPSSRKELQQFLGFANFYCHFIQNYGQVASPLTTLISTKLPFHWTPEASAAFTTLKDRFTSAPILIQPHTEHHWSDTSDSGVGAVLPERSDSEGKLHPCAFFSRKLSPGEQNYNVGRWELLPIKLALDEWRMETLVGRFQKALPHLDWPHNLMYLHHAKMLNSRQACWSLFLRLISCP